MEEGDRKEVRVRERYENATLLALKLEKGARSQGMQMDLRSSKRQDIRFSQRATRRNEALPTP